MRWWFRKKYDIGRNEAELALKQSEENLDTAHKDWQKIRKITSRLEKLGDQNEFSELLIRSMLPPKGKR